MIGQAGYDASPDHHFCAAGSGADPYRMVSSRESGPTETIKEVDYSISVKPVPRCSPGAQHCLTLIREKKAAGI
jgi:hypothetical protein